MASLVVIECREWVSFVLCPSREGTLALTTPNRENVPREFSARSLSPRFCVNNLFTSASDKATI